MREFTDEYGNPFLFRLSDVVTVASEYEGDGVFVTFRNGRATFLQISFDDFRQILVDSAILEV